MLEERAIQICAELLARRVVARNHFPDLMDEPLLVEEITRRLADVGMQYVDRTGIPFVGVVIRDAYVAEQVPREMGINQRSLALLMRMWLLLVAPYIYTRFEPPPDIGKVTVTETTLQNELRGNWNKTLLRMNLGVLRKNKFIETVRGQDETYCAGPMLWLAVDHDALCQQLRKEGVQVAVERYRRELDEALDHE